jgi:hypothetical protein
MWDRPPDEWPRDPAGHIGFVGDDLDLEQLLTEAPA